MHFHTIEARGGVAHGLFRFEDAGWADSRGVAHFGELTGVVVLEPRAERRLLEQFFDGKPIAAADALSMLASEFSSRAHPQVHAYANWGIDSESSHSHLQQLSVITAVYNDMGFRGFPPSLEFFFHLGLFERARGQTGTSFISRVYKNAPSHRNIRTLMPYSTFVDYIVKVRSHFITLFAELFYI